MRPVRGTLSLREQALVAGALLLPVPLLAQSGLSLPLPNAIERRLGSLVTLGADGERSATRVQAQAEVSDGRRAGRPSVAITRTGGGPIASTGSGEGKGEPGTLAESGGMHGAVDAPASDGPKGGDDTDQSPGATDAPADDGSDGSHAARGDKPGARLTVAAPGASAGASAGGDGLSIDVELGSVSEDEELTGAASVEVTTPSGSSTGADVAVPGVRVSLP